MGVFHFAPSKSGQLFAEGVVATEDLGASHSLSSWLLTVAHCHTLG